MKELIILNIHCIQACYSLCNSHVAQVSGVSLTMHLWFQKVQRYFDNELFLLHLNPFLN
jgi:hypothetical protein